MDVYKKLLRGVTYRNVTSQKGVTGSAEQLLCSCLRPRLALHQVIPNKSFTNYLLNFIIVYILDLPVT